MRNPSYLVIVSCFVALSMFIVLVSVFFVIKARPKISIVPERALIDRPLEISVSNLKPRELVTLEISAEDKDAITWKSSATFQADGNGVVNAARQAPVKGSYAGVHPMGLFWSVASTSNDLSKKTFFSWLTLNFDAMLLSVFSDGKLRAQKTIYRQFVLPHVERKEIRENGIVGTLFTSKDAKKRGGVITFYSSSGSMPEGQSLMLASHGYTVLALAYFGKPGLPERFSLIPLEYFQNAIRWFRKQPQILGGKVVLIGASRGGEVALLLASLFSDDVGGVIAYSAPSLVYSDFSSEQKSSWTLNEKPLPFMPYPSKQEISEGIKKGYCVQHQGTIEDPFEDAAIFLYGMKKFSNRIEATSIPVEKIRCPLLIISGDDDKLWPARVYGELMMKRLDAKGSLVKRKHMHYSRAGHNLFIYPYMPVFDGPVLIEAGWAALGGTRQGTAQAQEQSWKEVLNFLKEVIER